MADTALRFHKNVQIVIKDECGVRIRQGQVMKLIRKKCFLLCY